MANIDVLALSGTGHPNGGDGITEAFLDELDGNMYIKKIIPYPATFGGSQAPYASSRAAGRDAMHKAIKESNNAVLVVGYSQGAVIAGDVANEIAFNRRADENSKIVGCALIADGLRPRGTTIPGMPMAEGWGIAGERRILGALFPTMWAANPGDPICALPEGSALRTIADLSEWFSIRSPEDAAKWGAKMILKIAQGQMQPWWSPEHWRNWPGALAYARGYLWDGRHTDDYIRHGWCKALARGITERIIDG